MQPVYRAKGSKWLHLWNFFRHPGIPVTIAPYASELVSEGVKAFLESHPDALVVHDGLHAAGWTVKAGHFLRQSIYRAHNVEQDIWVRAAKEAKNPILHALLSYQSVLVSAFEKKIAESSRAVFPVSEVDKSIFNKLVKGPAIVSIPIGIATPPGTKPVELIQGGPRRILFVGRLDWPPNRDGLRWVLDKVWPTAIQKAPDLELTIIGSGDGEWLKPYVQLPGIRVLGRVESVEPYYAQCLVSIVPIFYGSGTRVKVIESSLNYRACISTAIGIEGIAVEPGLHYFQAETESEWIDVLTNLSSAEAREFGQRAFDLARKQFDPRQIAEKFLAMVQHFCFNLI